MSSSEKKYIRNEDYAEWEAQVIQKLKSTKNLKGKKVFLLQKLYIVLDSQLQNWQIKEKKKRGNIYEMYNIKTGDLRTYLHHKPYKRRSAQIEQYIACDLRGVTHYTVLNQNPQWVQSDNEYIFDKDKYIKQDKEVKPEAFVKDVLNSFYKIQKSNAKSYKSDNNPSKDEQIRNHVLNWFDSVRNIVNDETVRIRFAYAHFDADRIPNRTEPLRLFVPAKTIRKTLKAYYVRERDPKTKKMVIRECVDDECDSQYAAIDINDEKEIVDEAHLSLNEPLFFLNYQAVEQSDKKKK